MEIQIKQNVSLSKFCTYRVGGSACFFGNASTWQEILALREFAKRQDVPYIILGGGSNVLFADEGYPGMVILNRMGKIHFHNNIVTAESGVNLMKLLLIASEQNLGGISALASVPGSVGGAVYGNAGIPDLRIGDVLMHATILPEGGQKPVIVDRGYFRFGYRTSHIKKTKDIILTATLKLIPSPRSVIRAEIDKCSKTRALKQPAGNSCGSFFKNPKEFPSAGWLIEQSGCKGMKIGGAIVSPKHANFIMNTGNATASDILNLAVRVHQAVKEKFDVSLEPEVQIVPYNPFKL